VASLGSWSHPCFQALGQKIFGEQYVISNENFEFSGMRYYIEDHKRGAFEIGAPATDVLDVTGHPAEDFEAIARRYAAQARNQRTVGNWIREFAQFMRVPFSPGFDLDRYDRELRRPFPSEPQFAPDSEIWRREHAIANFAEPGATGHDNARFAAISRAQSLEL
jgi:NAD(P)H dehydrogenase (quinone)